MKRSLTIFWLLASLLLIPRPAATDDTLRGEPFTDPEVVQEMPAGWPEQPISHDPSVGQVDLVVTLDQHMYQFLLTPIHDYAVKHNLKIIVSEGTCGITAGKLVRKTADIGGYCCPAGLTDRLPGLRFHTLAIVPLQILVHPENPIDHITLRQARDIFQGTIHRWSEIKDSQGRPGPDLAILPVGRLHCKIRPGHWRLLLDNEDLFGPRLQEVGTIPDMISLVAQAPDAIGYEVKMMAERFRDEGKVKALTIDGQAANRANLLAGRYPLYRTLVLTTWEGENIAKPEADRLVEYLLQEGERLAEQYDLVPASALREAGWQFKDTELIGEP